MKRFCYAIALALLLASCQSESDGVSVVVPTPEPAPQKSLHWPDDPTMLAPGVTLTAEQKTALGLYRDIELGVVSEILAGTTHKIKGTMNTIEFKRITRDSRCPDGTECAGWGQLETEVKMTRDGKSETVALSGTPVVWNDVTLVLRDVLPHPSPEPQLLLPRMQLIVDKATVKYANSVIPGVSQTELLDAKQIRTVLENAKNKPPEQLRIITSE